MIFRQTCMAAVLFCLVAGMGCSPQKARPWVDLVAVSQKVKEKPDRRTVLETAEEAPGKESGPRVKDLSVSQNGGNTFLESLTKRPLQEAAPSEGAEGEGILLNFDNADIYEFIQVIAETLDINYIVDPRVKGVVNIRSGKKISTKKLFTVFKKILNINGIDIREEGNYFYIYPAKAPTASAIRGAEQLGDLKDSARTVMQVVPVMHLSSKDAAGFIQAYLSEHGIIHNLAAQNTLIIEDSESKVIDAVSVLSRLDISPLASLKVRLVRVEQAPLFDLRDELQEILSALSVNQKDFEGISVLPLERVNSLLLVSKSEFLLKSADTWIKELDVVPSQGRDSIYIYNVRNSVASELAELVNSLIGGQATTGKTTASAKDKEKTTATKSTASVPAKLPLPGEDKGLSSLRFAGEPLLLADDTRNIILIRALRPDYTRLAKLLERLDNLPRQVLIEVMVAEVNLTDAWELGVEWALKNNQLKIDNTNYSQTFSTNFTSVVKDASGGFTYNLFRSSDDIVGLINALGSVTDVSLLSSPHLLVLNNEEATVNVGDQVPIVTTETQREGESTTVDKTVQYKDTGTILTVTPRINYDGIIILDVTQQVSEATTNTTSDISSPVISTREIKTKLAVKNGQSILMGGLMKKKNTVTQNKVPLFGDIPLLGWLFKYEKNEKVKTELLVMITPYVIESEDVLDQYIRQFKEKMLDLRKDLNEPMKKKKPAG